MSFLSIKKTRKIHRYLGLFIGIQFLLWTLGGLYFSWTNLEEIHGDHFLEDSPTQPSILASRFGFQNSVMLDSTLAVQDLTLRFIGETPYYWINNAILVNALTGEKLEEITEQMAISVANSYLKSQYSISSIKRITNDDVDSHHEYREKPLPAWVIEYNTSDDLKAYVSAVDGSFQRVRHNSWRVFDFLWMLHTMDFSGRDNFNNYLLRGFSILGLLTISSGFFLFYLTSPLRTIRKR